MASPSMIVAPEDIHMSTSEEFDYLQHLDSDCSNMPLLSSPIDCPPLSRSFQSRSTALGEPEGSRSPSFTSSKTGNSPDWRTAETSHVTTPTTPMLETPFTGAPQLKCEPGLSPESMYNMGPYGLAESDTWEDQDRMHNPLRQMNFDPNLQLMGALGMSTMMQPSTGYNFYSQSMNINLSLSRPIFGLEVGQAPAIDKGGHIWPEPITSPPQTVVPSAAFRPMINSSPLLKQDPSTPRRISVSHAMLSSSPFTLVSPPILPSQHDVDDLSFDMSDSNIGSDLSPASSDYWASAITPNKRYSRPTMHRRGYERKRHVGPSCRPRPVGGKSGINCDAIISQNEFACSFPNCIDKSTNKQKRFKRQEHKKRHEKTVHEKDGHHKCWVPECKTNAFTRTDNLKSHLKNTHGKKSANQRNRYVATQDKNSEYYDPEWQGDLTKDGYPISPRIIATNAFPISRTGRSNKL